MADEPVSLAGEKAKRGIDLYGTLLINWYKVDSERLSYILDCDEIATDAEWLANQLCQIAGHLEAGGFDWDVIAENVPSK